MGRAAIDPNHGKSLLTKNRLSGNAEAVTSRAVGTSEAVEVVVLNSNGAQVPFALVPGVSYDYLDVQQTSSTVETYVYKTGGAVGNTVQTIVVTYTDNTKANIDTVAWS